MVELTLNAPEGIQLSISRHFGWVNWQANGISPSSEDLFYIWDAIIGKDEPYGDLFLAFLEGNWFLYSQDLKALPLKVLRAWYNIDALGGLFTATFTFPRDYPLSPPVMKFKSQMYHPNIYPNGTVCISILHPPGEIWRHWNALNALLFE